ncbi:hypothetical protein T492DRAFT_856403 [Pavlovales sp. CCMP2436]|nr:hypothetical protein T492DRAFT_856403 [Pavlovales sp. CCMP2436]
MKRRHLALAGWAVLEVPWWEWAAVTGTPRRAAYLASLLLSASAQIEARASGGSAAQPRRGAQPRSPAAAVAAAFVAPRPLPAQPRALRSWAPLPSDAALPPGAAPAAGLQPAALAATLAAAEAARELHLGVSRTAPNATGAASPPTRQPRVQAHPSRHGGGGGGSAVSVERVVALLVERVSGLSAKRGEALRAHLRSRNPFGLSWVELRCAGVGDRLAQKIEHELTLLAAGRVEEESE